MTSAPTEVAYLPRRAVRLLLRPIVGRRRSQWLFERLYELSLVGLNIGEAGSPRRSGERGVLARIAARHESWSELVVFDVGANAGDYVRAVLAQLGDRARVEAFEPSPDAFAALRDSLADHQNVRTHNLALSDASGTADLVGPAAGSKVASLHEPRRPLSNPIRNPVRLETLDSFCTEHAIERIHLLKLDVEGHELSVLRGASRLLADGQIDAVQFEVSAAYVQSRTFFRDVYELLAGNYRIGRVLQDGVRPIVRYDERHEIFVRASNYLAVRRDDRR